MMKIVKPFTLSTSLVLALIASSSELSAEDVTVFTEPPSAQELANILFPPSTRSIVMNGASTVAEPTSEIAIQGNTASIGSTVDSSAPVVPLSSANSENTGAFGLEIIFEFGTAAVTKESVAYLDAVGEMLNLEQAGSQAILIEGHTDAVGSEQYNQRLSEQRALAVRRYLISAHNIDAARLHPVGLGEGNLHDSDNPTAAINRRVEFRLLERDDS